MIIIIMMMMMMTTTIKIALSRAIIIEFLCPFQATDRIEMRSRDVGSIKSTVAASQTVQAPKEPSGIMAFRFIIAVAIISIIFGIFLGKKY
jgi:hypothetical protein